jgi:16S rRNA G966 N2-methylase RsmD
MNDLYIAKYIDLLKQIDESSEFEKILTNKYILLTCKDNIKLGNYQLQPLIKNVSNLYIMNLLHGLSIKNDEKILIISSLPSKNDEKFFHQFINVDFCYLIKSNEEIIDDLNGCNVIIILNDAVNILKNQYLLKIILNKNKIYYEYLNDKNRNDIKILFKHYKNFTFHSNILYIKKFGFIEFSNIKGGNSIFANSKTLQYKEECKSIGDGKIKCEGDGEEKQCTNINGEIQCHTKKLDHNDKKLFNIVPLIVPSIAPPIAPSIAPSIDNLIMSLIVPSLESQNTNNSKLELSNKITGDINSSHSVQYKEECQLVNGKMQCKFDGEKKDCELKDSNNKKEMVCKTTKLDDSSKITGGGKTFIKFMYTMYETKIKELNKKLREIEYVKKNYDKVMSNIDPYVTTLINNGIEYCNKYNIKYNKIYDDNFELLNHKKFVNKYFKKINNVNLNNVKISLDANYSITLPIAIEKIANIIQKEMPNVQYIIDGNANIGSTGIYLSTFFKHVYSVEVIKSTFDILVHNIKEYHFEKKITPFHDSIIDFMKNCNKHCHKFNIDNYCLFLDPPWSGVFYKTEAVIDLFFSNGDDTNSGLNIIDFIKSIKSTIKYICIKVPNNYNFSALYSAFYKITIHRLNGFYFVLLTI